MSSTRWWLGAFDDLSGREVYALMALRQRVFVVEQSCAYLDADGLDPGAEHLLGWRGDHLVAALRILPAEQGDVALGRVVTAPEARANGLGRRLMLRGLAHVRERWPDATPVVGAQRHLARFYGSLGFEVVGDPYDEDGIPHVHMRLVKAPFSG